MTVSPERYIDGATYEVEHDYERLKSGLLKVKRLMADARERTLPDIAQATGLSEASASARLRDLRKDKHGGHLVERRRLRDGSGMYAYRLVLNEED